MTAPAISDTFEATFALPPEVSVRAPGRINLIGEHTDYNDGFVLPAAIDKSVFVCASRREDQEVHIHAADLNESLTVHLDQIKPSETSWANYVLGGIDQLRQAGHRLGGINIAFGGDLPIGSGMSSSAAVETGVLHALCALFELDVSKWDAVKMAQRAEHGYAGVQCGIMDMFASTFGRAGHAMRLDCRSLEYKYIPLNLGKYTFLLLNTNVKHSLAASEYNTRRQEVEKGVKWINTQYPEVKSLRDITTEMLDQCVAHQSPTIYNRCKFVLEENERVLAACEALRQGRLEDFGQALYASHAGLRDQYEVSCPELDFLVDFARNHPGVLGARMMGGGFGGCTLNLVHQDAVEALVEAAEKAYAAQTGLPLSTYIVSPADGVQRLS